MIKIGLTGSIGSGKSTVSRIIQECGFIVIDADKISRDLTSDNSPIIGEIVECFGDGILDAKGSLDRKKLASIVFNSTDKKETLQRIVTDRVKETMDALTYEYEQSGEAIVFMDIPLLFEYKMNSDFNEVWSVVADTETRYLRAKDRDGMTLEDFQARDNSQVSQEYKIANSDVVIENNYDMYSLRTKILEEINRLKNDNKKA